ncbi:hypothetical protein TRAPUB_5620 [Trametes pubescens]|uniref:Uncharacterized protein n=1 Tax=Trametes pubescens TaxID=154538 RepID=A0A1M2V886_TRAPU|nr:hypothetical protein TRAPUB_5620 [Trametes pubescens]
MLAAQFQLEEAEQDTINSLAEQKRLRDFPAAYHACSFLHDYTMRDDGTVAEIS